MHEMVPIILFLCLSITVLGVFYMRAKENIAMLEKGFNPREGRAQSFTILKFGMLLIGAGLGLLIAYIADTNMVHTGLSMGDNLPIYFSSIAIFGGAGLLIAYFIEKKQHEKRNRNLQ